MYIRMFHFANRNGIQQTSLDPTIDEFYYDGSARYRVISLNGVHRIAQITFLLYITCDSGFCGSRCAEECPGDTAAGNYTCTTADLDVQQNSKQTSTSSKESIMMIVISTVLGALVMIGLVMLFILIVIKARKWKGK